MNHIQTPAAPESIIIYNSPLEKLFWEQSMTVPVIAGIVVAITVIFSLDYLFKRYTRYNSRATNVIILVGIISMIATIWKLS